MTNEPTEFQTSNAPPFRRELIDEYLKVLEEKYISLASDDFSMRARLVVRREIESMKALIEEHNMDALYENLSKVFGLEGETKPKTRTRVHNQDIDEESSFRSKFSNGNSRAELDAAFDII
jgi:hypothetical protein